MSARDAVYVLLLAAVPALILLHLVVAPYTKVEESFHIQAIHDILAYGIPTSNVSETLRADYDHFTFPGAVPRTFVGAALLAGLARPFIWLQHSVDRQLLARAILGLFNAASLLSFAGGLRRTAGKTTAIWYLLFQSSQFHVLYYASRTLSNMFAFGMTTLALRYLLSEPSLSTAAYRRRSRLALCLLTAAGIIFRSELAIFLATNTIFLFATRRISVVHEIIPAGIVGLLIGLTTTVVVDSFFWQQFPLWPEFEAFKFNVIHGQASAWGIDPWYFYFINAVPRLLLNPLTYLVGIPISLLQPATRSVAASLLIPSLVFLAIYSAQPHKEWRFVIYTIPALTAVSAQGASYIWTHRAKSIIYRFLSLALLASTLASFIVSTFVLLPASSANYPGAHALHSLHNHAIPPSDNASNVSVYLGNLACQTGVTRFLQFPTSQSDSPIWNYDKTESPLLKSDPTFWSKFDYALVEPGEEAELILSSSSVVGKWRPIDSVSGFAGLRVLRPGDEALGTVEGDLLVYVVGDRGVEIWSRLRELARRTVTRGWWVEVRMESKVLILGRDGVETV
ncbi:putative alpha-1,6-mannosyltransferase subunit [Aspergillus japonicus CBS 114.51]|uniref:Mannosyltransferase n=2 Tax=Aspergillus TaxID=5052 RepID=A0A2V5H322_ASPV1|nr:putative alpha-1,6-mannosyltransferase subunit [Aspergillus japonicus CBS 114.51]PYI18369.1 putative alpha-1,6-mannosyltransferase subunit [Aspergillus violaceofuscus CBS 115571]RAH87029.1 putative alpha-1,6-mannosyltransferase subunit [Aspergillus japonicus CBS 114.51]